MKLSVIIVNYNVKYFLEQCLCAIYNAIEGINAEIIVTDNNSTDNSVSYLTERFPFVHFIVNKQNLGFGKANNLAVKQAKGEYILLLNPDTIITENSIKDCLHFMETTPHAGAVGLRMLDGSGNFLPESKRSLPSPLSAFYKLMGLAALFPSSAVFNRYALGNKEQHQTHEVDVLCGAFLMLKKQLFNKLNGFDEDFFMYGEDVDLSYRIQKAGYKNFYRGENCIIHFKGESSSKATYRFVKMMYEAMQLFVKKHYGNKNKWLLNISLQAAIRTRKLISVLAAPFKRLRPLPEYPKHIVLIGSEDDMEVAKQQLATIKNDVMITTIPYPGDISFPSSAAEIIFCMGRLSYIESIKILQQLPAISVKWFGKNAGSMAGSNNKNRQGDVYIIPSTVNTHPEP